MSIQELLQRLREDLEWAEDRKRELPIPLIDDLKEAIDWLEVLMTEDTEERMEVLTMERLTYDGNFCDIAQCAEIPGGNFCEDGACSQKKVWERLKAYEDTGMSPQACEGVMLLETALSGADYSISRMVELMCADKDGRLVVLPLRGTNEDQEVRG